MSATFTDVPQVEKRNRLNERLALLTKQYGAAWGQLNTTIDRAQQVTIRVRIDDLYRQMEEVAAELSAFDSADFTNPIRQQRAWKQLYPHLDFDEPWRRCRTIFNDHLQERSGGAMMLLLSNRKAMCAELLVQRLGDWLGEQVGYRKVVSRPIQLLDSASLNHVQFLHRLGSYYDHPLANQPDASSSSRLREHTGQLVRKMLHALDPQDVLLVDVTVGRGLYAADDFVNWLIDDFWRQLRSILPNVAADRPYIKCIVVLSTLDRQPEQFPHPGCYAGSHPVGPDDLARLVCLPLTRWSEDDIERWLYVHSRRTEGLTADQVREQARTLYLDGDEGVPVYVLQALQELVES